MVERFVTFAGSISIDTGESSVVGTGTVFSGKDREGAQVWVHPAAAAPYRIGTVAAVEPRGIYENLALPLLHAWQGAPVVDQPYELLDGMAIANGATQASIFARFAAFIEQTMGLVGNTADDVDMSLVPNNTLFVDDVTRTLFQWRNGTLEIVFVVGLDAIPFGPWVGDPIAKFALAVVTAEVAVDFGDGLLDDDGVAHFQLDFAANFELQLPTNVAVDDVFDILFVANGGGDTPTFAAGYGGVEATDIRTADEDRTRIRFTVTAETAGVATAVTAEMVTFQQNALIEDGGFNFVSNVATNDQEPQFAAGEPLSDAYWTWKQGAGGEAGSSDVVGTSASNLAIGTGAKAFTTVEEARGWGVGARLRASSDASPISHWMEGVVTAYDGENALTITVDKVLGAGSRDDWTINLAGEPGVAVAPTYREVTTAGAVTVDPADDIIGINKSVGAATTVNLGPSTDRGGRSITIMDAKGDAATNAISFNTDGAETISGLADTAFSITDNYGTLTLFPVTGGWIALS